MCSYKIISDSSCDLSESLLQQLDISLVPYYISFDTINYHKEMVDIKPQDFYKIIIEKKIYPKTSLPPIQDYIDVFEPHLKEGKDIICMCLTSKFSGSFQSANNAKTILLETYPNRTIEVVDSILVTGSQGLLVMEAARMRDAGFSLADTINTLNHQKETGKINFTVDALDYLQKGGRIGKVSAFAGTLLNIKPIIVVENGELIPHSKVRGHKRAMNYIIQKTITEIGDKKEKYQLCLINASRSDDIAYLRNTLTNYGFEIYPDTFTIGITIGTHIGPTAIGICYLKKYECLD